MNSRLAQDRIRLGFPLLVCLLIVAPLRGAAGDEAAKATSATKTQKEGAASNNNKPAAKGKSKKIRLAKIVLSGSIAEAPGQASLFGDLGRDLRQTIARFDKAAKDEEIDGLVLEIKGPGLGRGRLHEVRDAIHRFRSSGKKVHAYFESATTTGYMVAVACDEITMPESGDILIPGVYAEMTFYKGLLDKVGLKADFIHIGEAKGAAEPMTRKNMSKGVRENLTNMIDDLYNQIIEDIARGRRLPAAKVTELIDKGIFVAERAKEAGLVDQIAYPDEFRKNLAKTYHADELVYVINYGTKKVDTDFSGTMGLIKLMQAFMGVQAPDKKAGQKKIAIVYAVGPIFSGKSLSGFLGSQLMGSDTIVKALKKVADDDKVVAVVFRIESPGGSALASDLIWKATREVGKPIVASMGDVAASGGYYIAMGCDKIYAEPATLTGSIGVVGGKIVMGGLYKKLGVTTDTITRGANARIFNTTDKWNDSERNAIRAQMLEIYKQFTTKAADGRRMPLDRLKELAGGKVYTGRDAKQLGLIDELGTLRDAIAAAKTLAGLDKDDEVGLEILPDPPSFFESLFGDLDEEYESRMLATRAMRSGMPPMQMAGGQLTAQLLGQLSPELLDLMRRVSRLRMLFKDRVVLVMPYELEIK